MLSIIIPSRNEIFLDNTIKDVLQNATGEIEILVFLDGYDTEKIQDARVTYINLPTVKETQKRHAINQGVAMAQGKYVMSLDAHCMMAKGFDVQLAHDHKDNWVQIPRRNRLDAENWCLQDQVDNRPPIDYETLMWPLKFDPIGLHGFKWDAKTWQRLKVPIDETMTFQGSCWFMTKDWFKEMGLMQIEGYTGWGQEAEEIGLKTFRAGGSVITNKNTWYAHLHKGHKYGRMYWMSREATRDCVRYAWKYWAMDNKEFFIEYIEKFMEDAKDIGGIPGWPPNWKERIWG